MSELAAHVAPTTRTIDPFAYFPTYASALGRLGGPDMSPDLNYCFHTLYEAFEPGLVLFRVTLEDARASQGELSVRVHAYRPDSDVEISLAGGSRTVLDQVAGDLQIGLRANVLPGVLYALYGYLSAPSDLQVRALHIAVEETASGDAAQFIGEHTARTLFQSVADVTPNRLVADGAPTLFRPASQPCTLGQLVEAETIAAHYSGFAEPADPIARWRDLFALRALESFGMVQKGVHGLILAPDPGPVANALVEKGCTITALRLMDETGEVGAADTGTGWNAVDTLPGQFDFLVAAPPVAQTATAATLFAMVNILLRRMLDRGIAVILFDYASEDSIRDERWAAGKGFYPGQREIEQLAMRIIGQGCDVAQLNFPDPAAGTGSAAAANVAPYALVVRR